MKTHDIITIGASSGGVEAITRLLALLPGDLPAAIFVVLHIGAQADDLLPSVLRRDCKLPVKGAVDGETIVPGHVYVAMPDHHLIITQGRLHLTRGAKENRHRPAIDPLFRSAAKWYGPRVVGVIMTGKLDDGVVGLNTIKVHAGIALVQSPDEAVAPELILHALKNVQVDEQLSIRDLAQRLTELATTPVRTGRAPNGNGHDPADAPEGIEQMMEKLGSPVPYICPQCHGPLWEKKVGKAREYRCHVGHAFSSESLLVEQNDDLERALWTAIRLFDEQADLLRRLARRDTVEPLLSKWKRRIRRNEQNAAAIRTLLQTSRLTRQSRAG